MNCSDNQKDASLLHEIWYRKHTYDVRKNLCYSKTNGKIRNKISSNNFCFTSKKPSSSK